MREIEFRGIPIDDCKWVYGYYFQGNNDDDYIITLKKNKLGLTETIRVDSKTVTQYTGLNDSTTWNELTETAREQWILDGNLPSEWEGKKIFEGDIVEVTFNEIRQKARIWFSEGCFLYELSDGFSFHIDDIEEPKIIGNIFDNNEKLQRLL